MLTQKAPYIIVLLFIIATDSSRPEPDTKLSLTGVTNNVIRQAENLRDEALLGTKAWDWVESLTTEVGPRLAGSAAEESARAWAVSTLLGLGFENVRVDPFTIQGWQRGRETANVISPFPQSLTITALGGSVATHQAGIEAEVALFSTLDALKKSNRQEVEGKIVYVGHAMQRTQDGSSYGYFVRLRSAAAIEASKLGAVAALIRSIGTDSNRMPHTGSMTYDKSVLPIPAAALSNPDADQLERMAARGEAIRLSLNLTPKMLGDVPSGNVIAEIEGSEFPSEIVIIGGHLDSWDLGTGAIDDGAGIGITLEVMRRLKESGLNPRRTIRLVFWGAEEVGLLGGYAYREKYKDSLRQHVVGTESDFGAGRIWKITRAVSKEAEPLADLLAQLLEPLGIVPGGTDVLSAGPDLAPLVALGFPGLRLVQDGSDYFDLHHTSDDTLDKIDPQNLDQNVAAFMVFVWLAANSDLNDWGWRGTNQFTN